MCCVALIVGLALGGPNAAAATYPATNPRLLAMHALARDYWDQRGVPEFATSELFLGNPANGAVGEAYYPSPSAPWRPYRIVLDKAQAYINLHTRGPQRRYFLAMQCSAIVHEEGHERGLARPTWDGTRWVDGHPTHGVMSQDGSTPRECRALVRKMSPPKRRFFRTGY